MMRYDYILEIARRRHFDFLVAIEKKNPYHDPQNGQFTTGPLSDAAVVLQERIESGDISTRLDVKKQSKHIKGSAQYNKAVSEGKHPSILTIDQEQQQELIDASVKTGEAYLCKNGSVRVRFRHSSPIGVCVSADGGTSVPTSWAKIHLSKTGAHIVPDWP